MRRIGHFFIQGISRKGKEKDMETKRIAIRVTENDIQNLKKMDLSKEPANAQRFLMELVEKFTEKLPAYKKQKEKAVEEERIEPYSTDCAVAIRMEVSEGILEYCHQEDNILGKVPGKIDQQIIYVLEELPKHPERKFY